MLAGISQGKPAGIVTYSPGPYGGTSAAMAIQPILHEMGALPVAALVRLAAPTDYLMEDGTVGNPEARMLKQLPTMLTQLEWMACAMKTQREMVGMW